MSAAATTRQASASRTWAAWIPRERVDARHNRPLAAATDRQRVLLLTLEFLWKSRPYAFTSNDELAAFTGWDVRKVQRTLEELELDAFIHRELIAGRTDRVSGRPSVTARVAIIALARLSDQPVATPGKDLDQVVAQIRLDRERRQPPTVPFDRAMGARQICHRVHDNFGEGCTTNLSSPLCMEKGRQENTTTNSDGGPSSSSSILLLEPEPEPEPAGDSVAEAPENVIAPEPPVASASTHLVAPSPAPVETPPAPAVAVVATEVPAELVAAAAEAIPGVSQEWVRSLLRDCGSYGLDLALLVMAWVKIRADQAPIQYARVALGGWLKQLRAGEKTLEDVRCEVQGRPGSRASSRPFDPAVCLARLASHGWAIVPHGVDQVVRAEIPGRGAPLWKHVPSDLRQQLEEHKAEVKAYVLKRAAERAKAVALRE